MTRSQTQSPNALGLFAQAVEKFAVSDPGPDPVATVTQAAVTLMAIEDHPRLESWRKVLAEGDAPLVRDVVRSWRTFGKTPALKSMLVEAAPASGEAAEHGRDDEKVEHTG